MVYVPGGDDARSEVIGTVCIANVSGLAELSDYAVWQPGMAGRRIVRGHPRKDGWGPLVARALAALWPGLHEWPGQP